MKRDNNEEPHNEFLVKHPKGYDAYPEPEGIQANRSEAYPLSDSQLSSLKGPSGPNGVRLDQPAKPGDAEYGKIGVTGEIYHKGPQHLEQVQGEPGYVRTVPANSYQTNGINYVHTIPADMPTDRLGNFSKDPNIWQGPHYTGSPSFKMSSTTPEPAKLESSIELEHVEVTKEFLVELIQIVTTQNVTLYMKGITVKEDDEVFEKIKEEIEEKIKAANEITEDPLDDIIDTELGSDDSTTDDGFEGFKETQAILTQEQEEAVSGTDFKSNQTETK